MRPRAKAMELLSKQLGPATPDDAAVLARMSRDYIERALEWRWRREQILRMIRHPDAVVLCARCTTKLETTIGGFGIMQYGLEHAHLNLLAVRPALRRHRLATDILTWLEETADVAGASRIDLEVRMRNTGARAFYRSRRYEEIEFVPRYYSGVETAVRLRKTLR